MGLLLGRMSSAAERELARSADRAVTGRGYSGVTMISPYCMLTAASAVSSSSE
jgi:hypothetical protein